MRIPLGSAKGSILEATLTASPYRSPCLCSTSPTWTPTLTETLRSLGRLSLRLESMAWIRIAHLTASSPLGNSTRNMSPTVFHLSPVVAGEEWSQKLPVFFQEIERERLVLSGQGGYSPQCPCTLLPRVSGLVQPLHQSRWSRLSNRVAL